MSAIETGRKADPCFVFGLCCVQLHADGKLRLSWAAEGLCAMLDRPAPGEELARFFEDDILVAEIVNVNADEAAFAVAEGIQADILVFITDVDGLLLDVNNDKTLVGHIDVEKAKSLIETGMIGGGMLPKLKACIGCIENGVNEVHIINGNTRYNLITSLISPDSTGTVITE